MTYYYFRQNLSFILILLTNKYIQAIIVEPTFRSLNPKWLVKPFAKAELKECSRIQIGLPPAFSKKKCGMWVEVKKERFSLGGGKLNGVLFRLLFRRSREAHYQSLETHLSSIEEHLSKVANVKRQPPLHIQSILLEEFHHASIAAYQAKDEINTTFNIYLITIGLIVSGLPFLLNLLFQTLHVYTYLPGIFLVTSGLLLIMGGVLSVLFLVRFLQLTKERASSIQSLNDIKAYYVKHLDQLLGIEDGFLNQSVSVQSYRVPQAIRYTVSLFGSAYFSGATFIFCIPLTFWIGDLISALIFVVSFVIFQQFYLKQVARMSK